MLTRSIRQLDHLEQQALLPGSVQVLSYRGIAAILGISLTASRVIQHTALRAWRAAHACWGIEYV